MVKVLFHTNIHLFLQAMPSRHLSLSNHSNNSPPDSISRVHSVHVDGKGVIARMIFSSIDSHFPKIVEK